MTKKEIFRMMKDGYSDEEIKQRLGPTRQKAKEQKSKGMDLTDSPIYGLPFGIGDNPKVANKLREGLDRTMGTIGAPAAGIAKAVESGNPLDAIIGAIQNIGARSTEQKTVSESLGRPNETWGDMASNFGIDMATDPTTWTGAGILRNFATRGARAGAKNLGKEALKGTAIAGGATLAAKEHPEGAAMAMAPLALGGAFKGAGKIPAGFYSVLEQEIENLGKQTSKSMPSIKIAQALKKRPIKADEWTDVGMDTILSENSTYTPQQLLELVRKRRPELYVGNRGQAYEYYSTARGKLDKNYEDVKVKQGITDKYGDQVGMYDSGIPEGPKNHFGGDVISHYRTDMAENMDEEEYMNKLDELMSSVSMYDDTSKYTKAYNEAAKRAKNETTKSKDFVLNEVQSDVHQAANTPVYPRPRPNSSQYAWDEYNKLTPEQKKEVYGTKTQKHKDTANAIQNMYKRSSPENTPSLSKAHRDLRVKTSNSLLNWVGGAKNAKLSPPNPKKQKILKELERRHFSIGGTKKQYEAQNEIDQLFADFDAPNLNYLIGDTGLVKEANRVNSKLPSQGEYANFGARRSQPFEFQEKQQEAFDQLQGVMARIESTPNPGAAMANTWDLFGLKNALRDAVNSEADRFGIVTGDTVDDILGEGATAGNNPGRSKFYDEDLLNKLQRFLRQQGINDVQFGEPEVFRGEHSARFIPITQQIKDLVAKGMPLYAVLMALNIFSGQDQPQQDPNGI